jgi:hypothetical protein
MDSEAPPPKRLAHLFDEGVSSPQGLYGLISPCRRRTDLPAANVRVYLPENGPAGA